MLITDWAVRFHRSYLGLVNLPPTVVISLSIASAPSVEFPMMMLLLLSGLDCYS